MQASLGSFVPGERVLARAVVLEAFRRTPLEGNGVASFELKSPKGETVMRPHTR